MLFTIVGITALLAVVILDVLLVRRAILDWGGVVPADEAVLSGFAFKRFETHSKGVRDGKHKMLWAFVLKALLIGGCIWASVWVSWLGSVAVAMLFGGHIWFIRQDLKVNQVIMARKGQDSTKTAILLDAMGIF